MVNHSWLSIKQSDRGTGTDEDFTAYGISYAVSDDVSVSYVHQVLIAAALEDQVRLQ